MGSKLTWWPIGLLLLARLLVGLTYSLLTPPWESYDETGHFQYARYLAKHRTFTLQPGDPEAEVIWSKFQPPLYYALLIPALIGFDFGPAFIYPERNPFFVNGDAGLNYALHPPQPTGLEATQITALYIARAVGVLISTASVLAMLAAARLIWPGHPKLIWTATLLYAFWPQFLFVGSMATNDLLITSLATVQVYLVVVAFKNRLTLGQLMGMGLIMLAAMLTKLNGVALIPFTILALLFSPAYSPRIKWIFVGVGAALILLALISLASMQFVTDQVFQLETFWRFLSYLQAGAFPSPPGTYWWIYGFQTLIASYGWGNVETWSWVYWIAGILVISALGGLLYKLIVRQFGNLSLWLVLASLPVSIVGLSLALAVAQQDPFLLVGRYWLPGLSVIVIGLVAGWRVLIPRRASAWAWQVLSLSVIILGWLAPFMIIARTYAYPAPLTPAESSFLKPIARFGETLELVSIQPPPVTSSGQPAQLQLCWRTSQSITQKLALRLEILGPDGQGYGRRTLLTGNGNFPPHFWTPNVPFCELYTVPVQSNFPAPALGAIKVQWLDIETGAVIPAQQISGELTDGVQTPIVVRALSNAISATPPAIPAKFLLGENLQLNGYTASRLPDGHSWRITLHWAALGPISEDAVIFVHLRTAPDQPFIQDDGKPRQNAYPTNFWAAGEKVIDEHTLIFPDEEVPDNLLLFVGAYYAEDPATRLPVSDGAGQSVPNNEIQLTLP